MVGSKIKKHKIIAAILAIFMFAFSFTTVAYAGTNCGGGGNNQSVKTSIDLGCTGKGNPVFDLTFAIIRLLADGVGIAVVLSVVIAGIQYTMSGDDPRAVSAAKSRVVSAVTALFVFLFAYALINYFVPGGFLQ